MLDQVIGGRYKVIAKLGEGGMGAVYEARHTETSRRVAVKVISGDASNSPSRLARFETEAKSAGQLESQYIAQVLDAGRDDATAVPFLVMEYLTGEDLAHIFDRIAPLDPDLVLRIVAQACMGLDKAHAANIVHRDIKPANLLLAERDGGERVLKILDFGIAKLLQEGAKGLTRTGALIGSPMYMSPEQARGAGVVDHRADLWSLGVVMYEALAGKTPFHGIEGMGDLLMTICTEEPASIREVAPWVDEEIAEIVSSALKIDATARFQSAADMLKAIKKRLPMGVTIEANMLVAADQSRRPTARGGGARAISSEAAARAAASTVGAPSEPVVSLAVPSMPVASGPGSGVATSPPAVPPPARPHEGATKLSEQPVSAPPFPGTLASETDSARVALAHQQQHQQLAPYAPVSSAASGAWNAPPMGAAPQPWVPPPPTVQVPPVVGPKSRAVLWFGCGVAAAFMALVALIVVLVLVSDELESDSTEGPTTSKPAPRRPK